MIQKKVAFLKYGIGETHLELKEHLKSYDKRIKRFRRNYKI